MRRLLPVVLAALLAALLLFPAGAAIADTAGGDPVAAQQLLAAAEEGEPAGPSPDPDNSHAPADYEPPFLINAAVGLTALLVGGVVVLGALYYLLVVRPRNASR